MFYKLYLGHLNYYEKIICMSVEHYEPFSLVASFFRLSNKPRGTILNMVKTRIFKNKGFSEFSDSIKEKTSLNNLSVPWVAQK